MQPITVLLADDRRLIRAGLRLLLERGPGITVIAEATNAKETVALAGEHHPDVVLVDLDLPGGAIWAVRRIRDNGEPSKVVALTNHDEAAWVRAAIAAGVHGYLVKSDSEQNLLEAIRAVHSGRGWISFTLDEDLRALLGDDSGGQELNTRESEVLRLMALGYTYKVIADDLNMSIKTIEGYRTRICERLGLETRADLVRYSIETGLLDLPSSRRDP